MKKNVKKNEKVFVKRKKVFGQILNIIRTNISDQKVVEKEKKKPLLRMGNKSNFGERSTRLNLPRDLFPYPSLQARECHLAIHP